MYIVTSRHLNFLGSFNNFNDACIYAISYYIKDMCDGNFNEINIKKFLKLKTERGKINFLRKLRVYIYKCKDESNLLEFPFDNIDIINRIDSYKVFGNMLITNVGAFKVNDKDLSKFETLIVFK